MSHVSGADQLGAGESADLLRRKRHDLWRHHLTRARRAHRVMNRDVPDEKEPRKAPKIFVTAFYARSGPSWGLAERSGVSACLRRSKASDRVLLRALCRLASIRVNELIEKELRFQSFCNFGHAYGPGDHVWH